MKSQPEQEQNTSYNVYSVEKDGKNEDDGKGGRKRYEKSSDDWN